MTQDAIVTKLLPNGMAQVAVTRSTACGGNCGHCESCLFQNELKTLARNSVGAQPGQRVVIESRTSMVLGAAALVYVLPLVLFLAGYAIAAIAGAGEGLCIAVSFIGLIVGGAVIVLSQRNKKQKIDFEIVGLAEA